jgi:gliding motility-associated-like protein
MKTVCLLLALCVSYCSYAQSASFTTPDTVCVNSPVNITNTSTGASTYFWNFCVANPNTPPIAGSSVSLSGLANSAVFIDYAYDNGNYYAFQTNNYPGKLIRLDFGNSLLNTPSITDLGSVGGIVPNTAEGVQVIKNEGKWYVLVVGGDAVNSGIPSRIVKIELGTNIANNSPIGTNWGNIGNLSYPHDLFVFDDNGHWYGFTVNATNNTITRFDFTTSFSNVPSGVNLGNIANFSYPTGICAIKNGSNWHAFVTSATSSTLSRLDFGNSLLNAPTGINLGNIGGVFHSSWDIQVINFCGELLGYVINANTNDLVKLNFNSGITGVPTATSFGNIGNMNFPHCLSKLFRSGADLYTLVSNVSNSSITRLKFSSCNSSSIPTSTVQNPPAVSYSSPGVYNINLTINDGLPTQSSFCKQVVVTTLPHSPTQTITVCRGDSIKIGSSIKPATYFWSTGATSDSIFIKTPGVYWVESSKFGCTVRDSFVLNYSQLPGLDFSFQQDLCSPHTVQFTSSLPASVQGFQWDFGNGQFNSSSQTPTTLYPLYGNYTIKLGVQYSGACTDTITKVISVNNIFNGSLVLNADTTICLGDSVLLRTTPVVGNYCWQSIPGSVLNGLNFYVHPTNTTTYYLTSQSLGNNLVVNGDFSAGNTGFTSDYNYTSPNLTEGQYWIGTNPTAWNGGMSSCVDHTTGTGRMMLVNGSPVSNAKVWSQTVPVTPNTIYNFSIWITSIFPQNPANLQFSINNVNLGNSINANGTTCQWNRFSSSWSSGNNTSAVITIVNKNTVAAGNDFALDDIFFGPTTTTYDSIKVNVTGLCDSIKISGSTKVCSATDTLIYQIHKPVNCAQQYSFIVDNSFAQVISQDSTTLKLKFLQTGNTYIKVAYSNNCKTVKDSLGIQIKFSPSSIQLGPDIISCNDTSFTLHAGPGFETYLWQNGTTDSTLIVNTPGNYNVTAQNLCGNVFTDAFTYTKTTVQPFAVNPAAVNTCVGDSIEFNATGGTNYNWQPASNFNNPSSATPKAFISSGSSVFTVHISNAACARDTLINIPVSASPDLKLTVAKTNDVSCALDSAQLVVFGASHYVWSPSLYTKDTLNNHITVRPPKTMTYYVTGTNNFGCSGKDSITVYFDILANQKLYMPTAFTPNKDGLNDLFKPQILGVASKYEFKVFNRWGELVFYSKKQHEAWDGNWKGREAPGDVYVYYVRAEGICNGQFEYKGTFVLIR